MMSAVNLPPLTATEAAAVSRVPLKHIHRIISAGLLAGAVETHRGVRLIGSPGLLALKLAYVTADVLKPEARRHVIMQALEGESATTIRVQAVSVEVSGIEAELAEGLAELEAARHMVAADPCILGGTPCFAGTRIPVHDVAAMLGNGDTVAALLRAYPTLDERRVRLAPVYAAAYPRRSRSRKVPAWRGSAPRVSKKLRLADLPPAA